MLGGNLEFFIQNHFISLRKSPEMRAGSRRRRPGISGPPTVLEYCALLPGMHNWITIRELISQLFLAQPDKIGDIIKWEVWEDEERFSGVCV